MVFNAKPFDYDMLWMSFHRLTMDLARSYQSADKQSTSFLTQHGFFAWKLCDIGWTKINVDVVVPLDKLAMVVAAITHNHQCKWIGLGVRKDFW